LNFMVAPRCHDLFRSGKRVSTFPVPDVSRRGRKGVFWERVFTVTAESI
jgi:hypothetical protein